MGLRNSAYKPVPPASVDQRQAPRHRVGIVRATVRRIKAEPSEATLYDISSFGCRLAFAGPHKVDERLWLRFVGSMPIAATVVWCAGGFLGCRFDAPIGNDLLRQLIAPALHD